MPVKEKGEERREKKEGKTKKESGGIKGLTTNTMSTSLELLNNWIHEKGMRVHLQRAAVRKACSVQHPLQKRKVECPGCDFGRGSVFDASAPSASLAHL